MKRNLPLVTIALVVICIVNITILLNSTRHRLTTDKLQQAPIQETTTPSQPRETLPTTSGYNNETLFKLKEYLEDQIQIQESIISFLSQPVINNHNFTYIHNPTKTCGNDSMNVLFVTPSTITHFENRIFLRNGARGKYVNNSKGQAKLLFFLGKPTGSDSLEVQRKVDEESLKFGDIVQDGFDDTYRNIRFKAVSMLKWAAMFCDNAKYVIRTDDDVVVSPEKLVKALQRKSGQRKNFIIGTLLENRKPTRVTESKYFMSEKEFPSPTLPSFILGATLGLPMSSVKLLYQAALRVKPVWLDDVFITGICSVKVHVALESDEDFVFEHLWGKTVPL
jgi:hypothetical protein